MKKFQRFLVSWFLGFLVSLFLGFNVCWFLGFLVSKLQDFQRLKMELTFFLKIVFLYYHISISCFLEDIDLISKISKNSLNGSSGFVGARLVQLFQNGNFRNCETS